MILFNYMFGNNKDDIEEIFNNKKNLLKVNPESDRRDESEIAKDGKCIIF